MDDTPSLEKPLWMGIQHPMGGDNYSLLLHLMEVSHRYPQFSVTVCVFRGERVVFAELYADKYGKQTASAPTERLGEDWFEFEYLLELLAEDVQDRADRQQAVEKLTPRERELLGLKG